MGKDVYDIGELPPLGEVPPRMHGMLVRPDRLGDPSDAIRDEVIDVPEGGPHDLLVATVAAADPPRGRKEPLGRPGRVVRGPPTAARRPGRGAARPRRPREPGSAVRR